MKVQLQSLSSVHDRSHFACGEPPLDDWLKKIAPQQQQKNISRSYVAVAVADPATILGFYSITVSEIIAGNRLTSTTRLPNNIPVVVLGRFSVSLSQQGRGLGTLLLVNALERIREISLQVGIMAIAVEAKDANAADFYEKNGFAPCPGEPLQLFLFTKTLQTAYDTACNNNSDQCPIR